MKIAQHLTFSATPLSIGLSAVVILATALIGYYAWRRSGYARAIGWLELMRLAIVSLVTLLLNQPEWTEEYRRDVRPTIAVLFDDSQSMETVDVLPEGSAATPAISRAESIGPLIDSSSWSDLADRLDVLLQPLTGSDLSDEASAEIVFAQKQKQKQKQKERRTRTSSLSAQPGPIFPNPCSTWRRTWSSCWGWS